MKMKMLGLLAAGLLTAPTVLQAAVIGPGQYQDWVFDLSSREDVTASFIQWQAPGEDPLADGASIGFSFGSAVGLSDLGTAAFANSFGEAIDGAAGSISPINVPAAVDALFVRVGYIDDAFGFDNFKIAVGRRDFVDGTKLSVPEPGTLALLGLGLMGLGLSRRRTAA